MVPTWSSLEEVRLDLSPLETLAEPQGLGLPLLLARVLQRNRTDRMDGVHKAGVGETERVSKEQACMTVEAW